MEMVVDGEIYRAAARLTQSYGFEYALKMCEQHNAMAAKGNNVAAAVTWRALEACIRELGRPPMRGEALN